METRCLDDFLAHGLCFILARCQEIPDFFFGHAAGDQVIDVQETLVVQQHDRFALKPLLLVCFLLRLLFKVDDVFKLAQSQPKHELPGHICVLMAPNANA